MTPPSDRLPRRKTLDADDEADNRRPKRTLDEDDAEDERQPRAVKKAPPGFRKQSKGIPAKILLLGTLGMFGCCLLGVTGMVGVGVYDSMQEQKVAGKWASDPTATQNASLPLTSRAFLIEFEPSGNRCVMMDQGIERRGTWALASNPNNDATLVRVDFEATSSPGAAQQPAFVGVFEVTVIDPDHIEIVNWANKEARLRMVRAGK